MVHRGLCWFPAFLAVMVVTMPGAPGHAQTVWVGDFETGNTSQYNGVLNGTVMGKKYVNIVSDVVSQGTHAAKLELHDDATWSSGTQRRVELQHSPSAGRTAAGKTTCFAWSLYLPESLPASPTTEFGYWETNVSYKPIMAFIVAAQTLSLSTNYPSKSTRWTGTNVLSPRTWHRLATCVLWSKDANVGRVNLWFDGVQVVTDAKAQTLADDNSVFIQFGLWRHDGGFADVPVLYVDEAEEGNTAADVHYDSLPTAPVVDAGMDSATPDAGSDAGMPGLDAGEVAPDAAAPNEMDAATVVMPDAGEGPVTTHPDTPGDVHDGTSVQGGCAVTSRWDASGAAYGWLLLAALFSRAAGGCWRRRR